MRPTEATPPLARPDGEAQLQRQVTCRDCGTVAAEDEPAMDAPARCSACGSTNCQAVIIATTVVTVRDGWRSKLKTPAYKRGKGVAEEYIIGADLCRATGEFVEKIRLIDRQNDRYVETVTDNTGVVLHHVDEPLSEHWGHGSAKFKSAKKPERESGP